MAFDEGPSTTYLREKTKILRAEKGELKTEVGKLTEQNGELRQQLAEEREERRVELGRVGFVFGTMDCRTGIPYSDRVPLLSGESKILAEEYDRAYRIENEKKRQRGEVA